MKKLKNFITNAMFVTIGGYDINTNLPGSKWNSVEDLLNDGAALIDILIGLGSVVAVAMLIVAGYTLITAAGNPDKIEQGQKTITGAIIGLVVVWAGGLIVKFVLQTLGVI